jgi:hypothetical protein
VAKLACDLEAEHEPIERLTNAPLVTANHTRKFGRSQVLAARRE